MKQTTHITVLLFIAFALLSSSGYCYGQYTNSGIDTTFNMVLNFRFNKSLVDSGYMNNASSLRKLNKVLSDKDVLSNLDSIVIVSSTSPDGVVEHNNKLARLRVNAIKGYLIWKYPILDQSLIYTHSNGENWDGLKYLVNKDYNMPRRGEVLNLLDLDIGNDTKKWRLKQIDDGRVYEYLNKNMFKHLRSGTATALFYKKTIVDTIPISVPEIKKEDPVVVQQPIVETQEIAQPPVTEISHNEVPANCQMAVKTNLIYDAFGVANIAGEISLGKHLSLDLSFIYSPYTIKRDYKLKILSLQPELRYWISTPLKGHFVGVQAGVGWFNIAIDANNRYQDNRPLYSFGISYGYALPLSSNWGVEFTISGGYANYSYDVFYNINNGDKTDSKASGYWGITRLGINLIYKFNFNK